MRAAPLLPLLLALACRTRGPEPMAELGTDDWRLVELRGAPVEPAAPAGAPPPHLRFDPAAERVSGNLGCNQFSGPYTLRGAALSFGTLVATRMACPEPRMSLERAFQDTLAATDSHRVEGDTLVLLSGEAVVARLARE